MKTIATTLAAMFALAASPVSAQSVRSIGYGDLDLGSPQGQAELSIRVARAVKAVCGQPTPSAPREVMATRSCRREAGEAALRGVEQAIAQYRSQATERLAARR